MTPTPPPDRASGPVPPAAGPGRPKRSRLGTLATVLLGAAGAALIAAAFIHVPYVIISPGAATALDGRIVQVSGAKTYPHKGELLYLTVRVTDNDPNLYRWLFAELDGENEVIEKEDVIGCASYAASARLNDFLMQESQDVAKTVALRRLGYSITKAETSALIVDVLCGGPSEGSLEPGDLIVEIDGQPVAGSEEVGPLVQAHKPGEVAEVTVDRGGRREEVEVRLGKRDGVAYLGIATQDLTKTELPVKVSIDTRRVSGPSAGLAFTLAIIDDLTPGSLTDGRNVAVTGSINRDGTVGIVGGVEQKAISARDDGASMMLVPAGEAKEARDAVGDDLEVVSVKTVDDALEALQRAGGKGVPPPPPATTAPTTAAQ